MLKILPILFAILTLLHGLIHLLGFAAYFPLAKIPELPYKTSLLNGRWEVDAGGMRLFSLFWLLAALGFTASAIAIFLRQPSWVPVLLGSTLLSFIICLLDWQAAYRGALIDLVFLLVLFFVFGLRFKPDPFPSYRAAVAPVSTQLIPSGLPTPVERFYRLHHSSAVPVYTSAVISGRGTVRFMGITFPARLRFTHIAGQGYRHYIETTFYGLPLMKVNEHYLDGHTRLELPFGVVENDPKVDSAANQGLWGETMFYPAAFLTDPRTRWEAIDDTTARLYVPFGTEEQVFTLTFDPGTGMLQRMETLRFLDEKMGVLRWWGEMTQEQDSAGMPVSTTFSVTWEHEGTPWLVANIEEIVFNSDVSEYIRQSGP